MLIYSFAKTLCKGKGFQKLTEKYQSSKGLTETECHVNMSDPKVIKDTLFTNRKDAFSICAYTHLHIKRYDCFSIEMSLD